MPQEFRYPLTRYCLRGGAMTLPRAMVGLFPESGEITALDTRNDTEHTLTAVDQRTITGLGPLFKQHRMAVNDELIIRPLEDGRFAFTAVKRDQRPDYSSPEALKGVLDELAAASVPVSEAEVRALYQGLPDDVPLGELFAADERFVLREGRWHNALRVAYQGSAEGAERAGRAAAPGGAAGTPAGAVAGEPSGSTHEREEDLGEGLDLAVVGAPSGAAGGNEAAATAAPTADAPGGAGQAAGRELGGTAQRPPEGEADDGRATNLHQAASSGAPRPDVQAGLWQQGGGDPSAASPQAGHGQAGSARHGDAAQRASVFERRQPLSDRGRPFRGPAAASRDDEYDEDLEDDGAALEVTELSNRLRSVLGPLGFRIESVARGQLLLTADMGRKSYNVLAQLLTRNDRVDWADLLARRRSSGVRYLAVVGDVRALHRLTNPAELARATMWSWQALDRLATLRQTVSFSPIELESHFERDGLFEKGLERFEAAVAKRVAERGVVSELLSRLALMRAPNVFLLEDLAGELDVPRDRLLALLEMLSGAPFHLVAKVDHGEFVLRQRVADALENLASYASSLRERLPTKSVEKLTGLAEPDLLTEDELEAQTANEPGPTST